MGIITEGEMYTAAADSMSRNAQLKVALGSASFWDMTMFLSDITYLLNFRAKAASEKDREDGK